MLLNAGSAPAGPVQTKQTVGFAVMAITHAEVDVRRARERRPGGRRAEVRRSHLVERLIDNADRPLVSVVAPAGYGKTTLLRQWMAEDDRPFAWLELAEEHNDPGTLLSAVMCALHHVEPFGEGLLVSPSRLDSADMERIVHVGAALATRTTPCVIVLDDVHRVTSCEALHMVAAVLQHLPLRTQLVLAGRFDHTPELCANGESWDCLRLTTTELALDASEAEMLLSGYGVEGDNSELETLMAQTECWPLGLSLAGSALLDGGAASRYPSGDRALSEYFTREIMHALDERTVEFLTRTSVLEELTGSVCDAVTQGSYSARLLKRLDCSNTFMVPLDSRRERYRYHRLFRDYLQQQLRLREPHLVAGLHKRASAWYAQHRREEQAIRHAVAAGDVNTAADLVWGSVGVSVVRGRPAALRRWLHIFDDNQIAAHPLLGLAAAAVDVMEGHADEATNWLWLTEQAAADGGFSDEAGLEPCLRLLNALLGGQDLGHAGEAADDAFANLSDRSPWRAVSAAFSGMLRHLAGDADAARERFDAAAVRSAVLAPAVHAVCLAELALLDAECNAWDRATDGAEHAEQYANGHRLDDFAPLAIVPAVRALTLAHHGDAASAHERTDRSLKLLRRLGRVSPHVRAEVRTVLARTTLSIGNTAATRELLRDLRPLLAGMTDAAGLRERIAEIDRGVDAIADAVVGPLALTAAELRVLRYLPMHLSMSDIAEQLFVSRNTVKSQAIAIYRKLAVSSRSAAVARARDLGLLDV